MTSRFNELYAAEIRKYRHQHVTEASAAVLDADFPADVVRSAAYLAGLQWDTDHPRLLGDIEEVTS